MFWIGKLAFIFGVVSLGIIGVTRSVFAAFVKPQVDLSPACGPAEPRFNIIMNTNGFSPNGTIASKFVGSDSKKPMYGYFETNSTGGFNDVTFADDLKADHYKYFAYDVNSDGTFDGTFDIGAARVYAKVPVPCIQ
jgi:hypothetical protein